MKNSLRLREKLLAFAAVCCVRVLGRTLRFEFSDRAGMLDPANKRQLIWSLWHNRVLMMPYVRQRFMSHRVGAVLTSASKDGEILARVVRMFGVEAERGSTSRRGAQGLLGMMRWLQEGADVCITPDGPRGPAYKPGPGVMLLSQRSGVAIAPISMEYSSCWRLKSWDRFVIPKPFSKCRVMIGEPLELPESVGIEEAGNRFAAAMAKVTEMT